jgi:hypothetical protein
MPYKTSNKAHDDALFAAEQARQAVAIPGATAAQLKTGEITYHRAVVASCLANNSGSGIQPPLTALRELGVAQ